MYGSAEIPFAVNDRGHIIRTVGNHTQGVVPPSPQFKVLHLAHYAKRAAHHGGKNFYYTLWKDFCWPVMAFDFYAAV